MLFPIDPIQDSFSYSVAEYIKNVVTLLFSITSIFNAFYLFVSSSSQDLIVYIYLIAIYSVGFLYIFLSLNVYKYYGVKTTHLLKYKNYLRFPFFPISALFFQKAFS